MIQNYLKIALRNLSKNRTYAGINIFGLSVGIAACLLLFRLIYFELSFDRYHTKHNRIVEVMTNSSREGAPEDHTPGIPIPAMEEMKNKISQFQAFARIHSMWPTITVPDAPGSNTGKMIPTVEEKEVGVFTEPSFFDIFDWKWLNGSPDVLNEPNVVVLNRSMAERCFGNWETAIGKTVLMDGLVLLTIKGVVENAPENTDFPLHVIASYETVKKNPDLFNYNADWGSTSSNDQAFGLITDPGQRPALESALAAIGQEHYSERGSSFKKWHSSLPLSELHFNEEYGGRLGMHVMPMNRIRVLSLIGVLMIIMACFNFINLATAQAAGRAREVGVRKSLGSSKGQLVGQFMSETAMIVIFAVALGTAMAAGLAPMLKYISDVPDSVPFLSNPSVWMFLGAVTVLVTLLAGFYPSLVLSGFQPSRALKNDITSKTVGGISLRKALVVGQFMIAQALIVGTFVTVGQMNYLRNLDLGFKPDLVYSFNMSSDSASVLRFETLKNQIKALPAVESVSLSSDVPSSGNNWASNFALGRGADDAPFAVFMKIADADYLETYHLKLVAGRNLQPSDTMRGVLVNQFLLKKLGNINPEEALTKEFRIGGGKWQPIVGVVEDFKANSAREEMKPFAIYSKKSYYGTTNVKMKPDNMQGTVAQIQQIFGQIYPEQVFDGKFVDERIAEFYDDEARFAALCKGFTLLAILISCLGLYGLASLMTVQRTKEIGIRKVLGASVTSITGLLAKDFLLLVIIAIVIASPIAWYFMDRWLADFVYRLPLSLWIFGLAGVIAVAVAFVTVSFNSIRAALMNPVQSLRSE